jgi:hypothetical protein
VAQGADWNAWNKRDLADEPIVRLILDGTVVRVRLGRKAAAIALLVALGIRRDGRKVLLAVKNTGGQSEAAWRAVLDDLILRRLRMPGLLGDGRRGRAGAGACGAVARRARLTLYGAGLMKKPPGPDSRAARPLSLSRIRQRWGAELFRQIFARTVRPTVAAGVAKCEVVHIGATLIRAAVAWESLGKQHADALLAQNDAGPGAAPVRRPAPQTRLAGRSATTGRPANTRSSAPPTRTPALGTRLAPMLRLLLRTICQIAVSIRHGPRGRPHQRIAAAAAVPA